MTVDAYPNRPFEGTVLKIEPQAQTEQNVTMFPVLVRIDNREGLLRPGMNAEVEIHVGQREGVLAVPNAALRTQRDVGSAAQVLGLDAGDGAAGAGASVRPSAGRERAGGRAGGDRRAGRRPDRRRRGSGTAATRRRRPRERRRPAAPAAAARAGAGAAAPGRTALVRRTLHRLREAARRAQAGLDPDRPHRPRLQRGGRAASRPTDSVLILPSASLVQSQQESRERMNRDHRRRRAARACSSRPHAAAGARPRRRGAR